MRLRDRIDAGTYVNQANMRDALVAQLLFPRRIAPPSVLPPPNW
ncbi:bifunctional proline dehydrogenase/pyrroline-5-carboxylate dehydrogenase [Ruegeria sp. TrichCH4B]|nr:bifunctional proline dehydrogenase/pyrroline-5-carboxylate dehydrogenase [Ruegeria sp. TrichCH4B]